MGECRLALTLLLASAMPAAAWITNIEGSRARQHAAATAGVLAANGDLVATISDATDLGGCTIRVVRLSAGLGATIWSTDRLQTASCSNAEGRLRPFRAPLALDPAGDVLVGLPGGEVEKLDGSTGALRWRTSFNPFPNYAYAGVEAIAVDADGNAIAAGSRDTVEDGDVGDLDLVVVKLDGATGAELWRHEENGELPPCDPDDYCDTDRRPNDFATDMALTATGDPVVVGQRQSTTGYRFMVVALRNADGGERWRYDRPGTALAVALAGDGTVYAGGVDAIPGSAPLVALDGTTGAERWAKAIPANGQYVGPTALIALAALDDGVAAVATVDDTTGTDVAVARFGAAAGDLAWRRDFSLATDAAVAVTASATAITVAQTSNTTPYADDPDQRWILHRVALADGAFVWTHELTAADGRGGTAGALIERADGIVFALGALRAGAGHDAIVARLDLAGTEDWRAAFAGHAAGDDVGEAAAMHPSGDPIVGGQVGNADSPDFLVARLDRRSGEERWRVELDGVGRYFPQYSYDDARAVAVDSHGDVIAAGQLANGATDEDGFVVKVDGDTGAERWRHYVRNGISTDRDVVRNVAVDAAGDVFVLAYLDTTSHFTPVVAKIDGATGTEAWRQPLLYNGSPSEGVLATSDGDVLVAGMLYVGSIPTVQVQRLRGSSGTQRWQHAIPSTLASSIALDGQHVVLGGAAISPTYDHSPVVVALDVTTGKLMWQATPPITGQTAVARVAIDATGNVVATGETAGTPPQPFVLALGGSSGTPRWTHAIPSMDASGLTGVGYYGGIVAGGPDDVIVAGIPLHQPGSFIDFTLIGVDPHSGAERWRRMLDGTAVALDQYGFEDVDQVNAVAPVGVGAVVGVGITRWLDRGTDFTVELVDRNDGDDPRAPSLRRCGVALARVGRRLDAVVGTLARRCDAACREAASFRDVVTTFGRRARNTLARGCTATLLRRIPACADTLDELVGPGGSTGCLIGIALQSTR